MGVPKVQDDQTVPLWAHLMPGNPGPSGWVPAILGGQSTRLPGALGRAMHKARRCHPTPESEGRHTCGSAGGAGRSHSGRAPRMLQTAVSVGQDPAAQDF